MRVRAELKLSLPEAGVEWLPVAMYGDGVQVERVEQLLSGSVEVTARAPHEGVVFVGRTYTPSVAFFPAGTLLGPLPTATVVSVVPLELTEQEVAGATELLTACALLAFTGYFTWRVGRAHEGSP